VHQLANKRNLIMSGCSTVCMWKKIAQGIVTISTNLSLLRCGYKCKFWKASDLRIKLKDDNMKAGDHAAGVVRSS
jgi:hypothetical protein